MVQGRDNDCLLTNARHPEPTWTMPHLPFEGAAVPPSVAAGLLLCSIPLLDSLVLPHPTATAAIAATGVSRSRAYEVKAAVEAILPELIRPPGRPPRPVPDSPSDATVALTRAVLDYVMDHPGCVHGTPKRRRYADGLRLFLLERWECCKDLDLKTFSEAVRIPYGTLRDWIRGGRQDIENLTAPDLTSQPSDKAKGVRTESILAAYKVWTGSFADFCSHVQLHLHIPWGRTTIGEILHVYGVRKRISRRGRRPDEKALRGQFETFFGGAQWSADGSPRDVVVDGQLYTFNLELNVDTHTTAQVGLSVRDTEDGAAVVEVLNDGIATTGAAPIAQLLDNRPSNHTDEVTEALGDTIKIRRTQGRPQNGAHVEGSFGLFEQRAPDIVLDTGDPRELARSALILVAQTWARTLNHRAGDSNDERCRVQRYNDDAPTKEQVEAAKIALQERHRKQEKARQTRKARLDPVTREMLRRASSTRPQARALRGGRCRPDGPGSTLRRSGHGHRPLPRPLFLAPRRSRCHHRGALRRAPRNVPRRCPTHPRHPSRHQEGPKRRNPSTRRPDPSHRVVGEPSRGGGQPLMAFLLTLLRSSRWNLWKA